MVFWRNGVFGFHHFELFDLAFPEFAAKKYDGELGNFIALNQGISFEKFVERTQAARHNHKAYGVFEQKDFSNEEVFDIHPNIKEGVGFLFKRQFDIHPDGLAADIFCAPTCGFHHAWTTPCNYIKACFGYASTHFAGLLIVFIVFFESGRTKNGDTRSLKVQAAEALDELKENGQREGEFGESTSGTLINAKVVVAVVGIFFFHAVIQISQKAPAAPGLFGKKLLSSILETLIGTEEEIPFDFCVLIAVAAVNGIGINALCKQIADGTRISLLRIGGTDQLAEVLNGVVLF